MKAMDGFAVRPFHTDQRPSGENVCQANVFKLSVKKESLDDLKLGEEVGRGTFKRAYNIKGQPNRVLVVQPEASGDDENMLKKEITNLEILRKNGLPTAAIIQTGKYRGKPAMVMKKYKAVVNAENLLESKFINEKSLRDFIKIRKQLEKQDIRVGDLQFGIEEDGGLVIIDPLSLDRISELEPYKKEFVESENKKFDKVIAALAYKFQR